MNKFLGFVLIMWSAHTALDLIRAHDSNNAYLINFENGFSNSLLEVSDLTINGKASSLKPFALKEGMRNSNTLYIEDSIVCFNLKFTTYEESGKSSSVSNTKICYAPQSKKNLLNLNRAIFVSENSKWPLTYFDGFDPCYTVLVNYNSIPASDNIVLSFYFVAKF